MSIECGECEMDLRSGHAEDGSRRQRQTRGAPPAHASGVLDQPVRVDREGERLYFCNGRVSVDLNGSEAERKQVLEFLAQAQQMAKVLKEVREALEDDVLDARTIGKAVDKVLREAGVR